MPKKPTVDAPVKDKFSTIALRKDFADWLRRKARSEGRHLHRVVEDAVADGIDGRPWQPEAATGS